MALKPAFFLLPVLVALFAGASPAQAQSLPPQARPPAAAAPLAAGDSSSQVQKQQQELLQALKQGMSQESPAKAGYADFVKRHYYLFDGQKFSTIHCKIHMPALEKSLSSVRTQLSGMSGKFNLTDDMEDFGLILQNNKSLGVRKPHFDVESREPASVLNKQSFDNGRQQIVAGLDVQIDAAVAVIAGVFEEYTLSTQKVIRAFKKTPGGAEAVFEENGLTYKTAYGDAKRSASLSGKGVTGHETAAFTKLGGKETVSRIDTHMEQGADTVDFHTSVTYGYAGKIPFPKTITKERTIGNGGNKDTAKMELSFDGCTAE